MKNVDRVLSPPKSNNIMDYFKKTATNEKASSPMTEKESKASQLSLEDASKPFSRLKRKRKRCDLSSKLKDMKTLDLGTGISSDGSREICSPKKENFQTSDIYHSSPSLLTSPNAEEMINVHSINICGCKSEEGKGIKGHEISDAFKISKKRKRKNEPHWSESSTPEKQLKEQCKEVDDEQVASTNEPDNTNMVNILDLKCNPCMTPQLNNCTVTVSFEDFLKSHEENKIGQVQKAETLDSSISANETISCQVAQQLPPKQVTVFAEIHPTPPKPHSPKKIASIFLQQKSKGAKTQSMSYVLEKEHIEQMTQKRKSNVVLAEEELEMAVLEIADSDTVKSKSTAEERYQFMKAFRQSESDTQKDGSKKGPGKQKEVDEKNSKHKEEMEGHEDASNKKLENEVLKDPVDSGSHNNNGKSYTTRKRNKLSRKRLILEVKGEDLSTNDNQNSDGDHQAKGTTLGETKGTLSQKKNGLRKSLQKKKREDSINSTPEKTTVSDAVAENIPNASPLQASTPKINKAFNQIHLYKAELITESFDSMSPIR